MKCNRCGNTDIRFFGYDQGIYYCRKCISFSRLNVGEQVQRFNGIHRTCKVKPVLDYELTPYQKRASNQVLDYLKDGKDVFLFATTGAGKTEITFESICYYLSQGKKVGFSISRRQVVMEIGQRLKKAFPSLHIVCVAQGSTDELDGDIIVCTMHQLYRYPYTFDLLIMDEVDAFPYAGNDVLNSIADIACTGQKLYLSATPDEYSQNEIKKGTMKMVQLFKRPHGHPLPVPKVFCCPYFIQICIAVLFCLIHKNKQILLFVPRKEDASLLHMMLSLFITNQYIHSQIDNKDKVMEQFRAKKWRCLITTTLLERGITIPDVQVVVLEANHVVFTTASLIQIFGRAGRNYNNPEGECLCLCSTINKPIKECVKQLKMMNDSV